ncbi:hypothetical protein GCM10010347_22320 [Streptomyces cirratus]|uniref:Uncharacterized protein n=1 Tax=Streptomyces cirratus TaxID=68187 RepID=A0ABQ3EUL7_9ACTN|nr:hypothetical protein GCM10010347_22320 [Streptomyces cirratus]
MAPVSTPIPGAATVATARVRAVRIGRSFIGVCLLRLAFHGELTLQVVLRRERQGEMVPDTGADPPDGIGGACGGGTRAGRGVEGGDTFTRA